MSFCGSDSEMRVGVMGGFFKRRGNLGNRVKLVTSGRYVAIVKRHWNSDIDWHLNPIGFPRARKI